MTNVPGMPVSLGKRKDIKLRDKTRECARVECSKEMKQGDSAVKVDICGASGKKLPFGKEIYCSTDCADQDEADAIAAQS